MELIVWIVAGIVGGVGLLVVAPVLVVGTWFVVMTVILGLVDGIIWLLDEGWKRQWEGTPA